MKNSMMYVAVALASFAVPQAWAEESAGAPMSTAEMVAQAPTLQILLDASGSSPATDAQFMASAIPRVTGKIKTMPMGTRVLIVWRCIECPHQHHNSIAGKTKSRGEYC
jgi:hypothetical protein